MNKSLKKEIRAFNRFYTNIIGLLDGHILDSSYSLPEVRIMFELYYRPELAASDLMELIAIDKGYLSRILKNFQKNKLITKVPSALDKRSTIIQLTDKGKKEFEVLDHASDKQIENLFAGLTERQCASLVQKMKAIQEILGNK